MKYSEPARALVRRQIVLNSYFGCNLMRPELIPPPDLAPPSIKHLPIEKRIELWEELVDESEALLLAGLQAKIGPHCDLKAAYRQWYVRHMEDHDRMQSALAENLSRCEARDGR